MAINTNVQGNSLIPETQRKYLELLMQNYPEYKAGLFESTPDNLEFEDVFQAPRGPLYNVKPTAEQLAAEHYYYDEGDVDVATFAPKGPLYDVDPERSGGIIEAMYNKLPEDNLDELLKHDIIWNAKKCLKYGLIDKIV